MNRRDAVLVLLALAAVPQGSAAQPAVKLRRIGFLAARSHADPYYDAFTQGMRDLGYVEGKSLHVEWRYAEQKLERLPALAGDLVRQSVEVIVTHSTAATRAAVQASNTIPIVCANMGDPVGSGFAASLGRPGGNITGLSGIPTDVSPKQVELLKLVVPHLSRAAVLANPETASHSAILKNLQAAAQRIGVNVLPINARTPKEIEHGFESMKREHADAVFILGDSFFIGQRTQISRLAARYRLPSMFEWKEDVEAGGLMSYGQSAADSYRRAATYVDKILKGAKPGDLPIEQPTKFEFVVNLKTAKALGVAIPQQILLRADRAIE